MNAERKKIGYISIAAVTILIAVILAYVSIIPLAKAADDCLPGLTYYVNRESPAPPGFYRSTTPWDFATSNYDYVQTITPSYGVITTLTPMPGGSGYADLGFGYTFGELGAITTIPIVGSGTYAINIYIDMNTANDGGGNGPFFNWNGNAFLGLDGDEYGLGTAQITGNGAITTASSFSLVAHGYSTYTIAQLQSGAVVGIDGNTIVGFWFGITNGMNPQFEIDFVNGQAVACPPTPAVGGVWIPGAQIVGQLVSYAVIMSAVATSFIGLKRLKKKN